MPLFSRSSPERVYAAVRLVGSAPGLRFPSLVPGVDNVRHDVHLNSRFIGFAKGYILKLFMKHSRAPELAEQNPGPPKPQERNEFKRLLQEGTAQCAQPRQGGAQPRHRPIGKRRPLQVPELGSAATVRPHPDGGQEQAADV